MDHAHMEILDMSRADHSFHELFSWTASRAAGRNGYVMPIEKPTRYYAQDMWTISVDVARTVPVLSSQHLRVWRRCTDSSLRQSIRIRVYWLSSSMSEWFIWDFSSWPCRCSHVFLGDEDDRMEECVLESLVLVETILMPRCYLLYPYKPRPYCCRR